MLFDSPVIRGTLVRRYKRFLADIEMPDGDVQTVHCANPGSMAGLTAPGLPALLSTSPNRKRKLPLSLEAVQLPTGWVGVNTAIPNRLVGEALSARAIAEVADYETIRPETRYGEKSRVDFLLTRPKAPDVYLEVKNVHFSRTSGLAEFPDSRTQRGARHLDELAAMVQSGHRAINLYLIQRSDCSRLSFAADFDPDYAAAATRAAAAGVEFLAYDCHLDDKGIVLRNRLPVTLPETS